jgi:hypothetical protein
MKLPINGGKITLKATNSNIKMGDPNLTTAPTVTLTVNSTSNNSTSGTNITASIVNNDASTVSITDLGGSIASKGDFGLTVGQTINSTATLSDNTIAATPGQSETFSVRVIAAGENRSTPIEVTLGVSPTPQVSLSSSTSTTATFSFSNIPVGGVVYATVNGEQKSRTGDGTIQWTGLSGATLYSTSNVYVIQTGVIPSAVATVNASVTTGLETTATPTVTLTVNTDIEDFSTGTLATVAITNNDTVGGVINILDPGGSNLGKINLRTGFDLVNGQSINAGQTLTDTGIQLVIGGDARFRASVTSTNKNSSDSITRTLSNAASPFTITAGTRTATSLSFEFATIPSTGKLWAELRLGTLSTGTLIERKSIAGPGPKTLTWTGLSPNTQYTVRAYNLVAGQSRSSSVSLTESTTLGTLSSPEFSNTQIFIIDPFAQVTEYGFQTTIVNNNSVPVVAYYTLYGTDFVFIVSGTLNVAANSTTNYSRSPLYYPGARLNVYFSAANFFDSLTTFTQAGDFTSETTL